MNKGCHEILPLHSSSLFNAIPWVTVVVMVGFTLILLVQSI
jgi:hypothetical protein